MPKLWTESIEAHRQAVREATLDTTAALVARHGLRGVTMSRIAQETGIGRATLYKYFADVESILLAWHERQIAGHFEMLTRLAEQDRGPGERLKAVLEAYALIQHRHPSNHLAAVLHSGEHAVHAETHLRELVRDLVAAGAEGAEVRRDVSPDELTNYCLHALRAAGEAADEAAVRRLVELTIAGISAPEPD